MRRGSIKVMVLSFFLAGNFAFAAMETYELGAVRTGELPAYRTYDKVSSNLNMTLRRTSYEPMDANEYWGERYYGNKAPDARKSARLDFAIRDLEVKQRGM